MVKLRLGFVDTGSLIHFLYLENKEVWFLLLCHIENMTTDVQVYLHIIN